MAENLGNLLRVLLPVLLVITFALLIHRVQELKRERDYYKQLCKKLKEDYSYKGLYEEERKIKMEFREVIKHQHKVINELRAKKENS